ncbi:hypothetical protein [Thiomonas sp.]|uniref:hypothetical protein n=1 Tax=Thiomonas sp. TaxID=2047785 RepID=UPI002584B539|nr:hypothetical protein [Thiomonas sp.]
MSMAQRYAGYLDREANRATTPVKAEAMRQAANKLRELERENKRLRADAARLDWLSDPDNPVGNVQLPTHCVTANLHSLRDAIDMAMREQEHDDA